MSLRKISFVCFRETFYQLISESAGRSAARTARDPQIADIWVCVRGFDLKPIDSTTPALPFAALMQHCSLTTGLFLVKIIKKKTGLCFYKGQNKAPCLQTCTWRSRNPCSSRSVTALYLSGSPLHKTAQILHFISFSTAAGNAWSFRRAPRWSVLQRCFMKYIRQAQTRSRMGTTKGAKKKLKLGLVQNRNARRRGPPFTCCCPKIARPISAF